MISERRDMLRIFRETQTSIGTAETKAVCQSSVDMLLLGCVAYVVTIEIAGRVAGLLEVQSRWKSVL